MIQDTQEQAMQARKYKEVQISDTKKFDPVGQQAQGTQGTQEKGTDKVAEKNTVAGKNGQGKKVAGDASTGHAS